MFKSDLESQTFYSIPVSWKLLSCHSQAVRPYTDGFVHFSKGWQPLPLGISVCVSAAFCLFFPQVKFQQLENNLEARSILDKLANTRADGMDSPLSGCGMSDITSAVYTTDPQGAFVRK